MFCPKCGSRNDETALYCTACGNALPLPDAQGAVALDEYYKAIIGPKNQDYYLSHFSRFDREGARISWNWPSFFMTFYWLLYRKMWLNSLAYFLFPYVLAFVFALFVVLTDSDPGSLLGSVYLGYLAAIFVLIPMYANALELSLPPSVKGLSFDRQSGVVSITVEGSTVNGKSILFVPSLDTGNKLVWTCMSEEIQDRYLPVECRQRR